MSAASLCIPEEQISDEQIQNSLEDLFFSSDSESRLRNLLIKMMQSFNNDPNAVLAKLQLILPLAVTTYSNSLLMLDGNPSTTPAFALSRAIAQQTESIKQQWTARVQTMLQTIAVSAEEQASNLFGKRTTMISPPGV